MFVSTYYEIITIAHCLFVQRHIWFGHYMAIKFMSVYFYNQNGYFNEISKILFTIGI